MKSQTLWILAAAAVGYYLYTKAAAAPGVPFVQCRYPDGSIIQVPSGNACPFDVTHGGQSVMCYPQPFIGPLPQGGVVC